MKFRVDFENNLPAHATEIKGALNHNPHRAEFDVIDGKSVIKCLYLDADNSESAIRQAKNIVDKIFLF
jgi:hypothetical protein